MLGTSEISAAVLLHTSVWFLCNGTVCHRLLLIRAKY